MATLFKDIGKKGSDLLKKDFPSQFELKAETTAADTKWTTKVTRDAKGVTGSISPVLKWTSYGEELKVTADTSKKLEAELSVKNQVLDGLKVTVKGSSPAFDAAEKQLSLSTELEYKHEKFAVNGAFDLVNPKGQSLKAAVAVPVNDVLTVGAQGHYSLGQNPQLKSTCFQAAFKKGDAETRLYRCGETSVTYGLGYFFQKNADLAFSGLLTYDATKGSSPELTFGTERKVDSDNTLKTKFSSNGRIGVGLKSKVNDFTTLTLGVDVNSGDTSDHKLGATIAIDA